jgi:hypothetical protein
MGGIFDHLGLGADFLANRAAFYDRGDTEGAATRAFLSLWWGEFREMPVPAARLHFMLATMPDAPSLASLEAKNEQGAKIRLGRLLSTLQDRRYRLAAGFEVAVRNAGDARTNVVLWRLERVEGAASS